MIDRTARRRPSPLSSRTLVLLSISLSLALIVVSIGTLRAQTATLTGIVTTAGGTPVPNATLIATEQVAEREFRTRSDDSGRFSLTVEPGTYTIRVIHPAFDLMIQRDVRVTAGASASVTLRLRGEASASSPTGTTGTTTSPPPPKPAPTLPPPPPETASTPIGKPAPPPALKTKSVFWNSWLSRQDRAGVPVDHLTVGQSYVASFDLSPYTYERLIAGAATATPDRALRKALDDAGPTLSVRVYAAIGGRGAVFTRNFRPDQTVVFKTDRLRRPPAPRTANEPFARFQERVTAGRIEIPLDANEAGCATIALSIWAATRNQPLDHVMRRIVVADAQGRRPECGGSGTSTSPLTAQRLSLLTTDRGITPAIGLHIFQMNAGTDLAPRFESTAVFVSGDGEWLSWQLPDDLSKLMIDRDSLLRSVEYAHGGNGYAPLMRALTDAIFPTGDAESPAQQALTRLREAAGASQPDVFVRLVDISGTARLIPIGLIDDGHGAPIGRRLSAQQPLPRETAAAPASCISNWTLVLPDTIDAEPPSPVCSAKTATGPVRKWPAFADYLRGPTPPAPLTEGLLLLAHQSSGSISFERGGPDWARPSRLARKYAPGSVAVVIACNVAAGANQYGEDSWLSQLNQRGVDAEIVSPFEVPIPFGTCFARHLANHIQTATDQGTPVSLVTLFQQASAAVQNDYARSDDVRDRQLADAAYEFVLAGQGNIRTCGAGTHP